MSDINLQINGRLGEFSLDVDFVAPAHGVTALFGHSAAGKTTVLRCIAGLESLRSSYVNVAGEVWEDTQQGICLPTHKRTVAYVFQESLLFPHMSVEANIRYGLNRRREAKPKLGFEAVVEFLQLSSLLNRAPGRLSGGEQKRVAIARALLSSPKLLLMDEPLANLDEAGKQEILPFLEHMHQELDVPLFYVCHSMSEVVRLADSIVLMEQGRVRAYGELLDVLGRVDVFPGLEGSVLEGTVVGYDAEYALTEVQIAHHRLLVGGQLGEVEGDVRLFLSMKDVSITLEAAKHTSVLNILPVTIESINAFSEGSVVVKLRITDSAITHCILAKITQYSCQRLALSVGQQVYAQVKGVALAR